MSIVEIDRSLLLAVGMFVAAALVALRWAEAQSRRIATERARSLIGPVVVLQPRSRETRT